MTAEDHHAAIEVENNTKAQRYEAHVDGRLAVAAYRRDGNIITFTHTGVPEELEGRGIANALIQTALDDARAQHLTVVPLCPFVAAYIKRHPAYADLVQHPR